MREAAGKEAGVRAGVPLPFVQASPGACRCAEVPSLRISCTAWWGL